MSFEAKVITDSFSPNGDRLITQEVTFPRMILPEFNTHRMFSRNSASSRAIPVEKQLTSVLDNPYIPENWGINQPGMQSQEFLDKDDAEHAKSIYLMDRDFAVLCVTGLIGGISKLKDESLRDRISEIESSFMLNKQMKKPLNEALHKQYANRLLEPFMWHTVVVTATEWDNFYALRINKDAQPEINKAATLMFDAQCHSLPELVKEGEYHLPFIQNEELDLPKEEKIKIAIGRCARVSYLTHDGIRDPQKDIELGEILVEHGHMSPTEHVATPMTRQQKSENEFSGNFRGWVQYRKTISNEDNYGNALKEREENA